LAKLAGLIEQAEKVFFDACRTQSWDFVLSDPMWLSWTLENFGACLVCVATPAVDHACLRPTL
jgi:hypothetical protein